jgi:hypothetical protein
LGLFSFIGGLIGAGKAKKASRRAETAQLDYLNKALAEQTRQFDMTQANFAPAQSLLAPSARGLGDLAGLNGDDALQLALDGIKSGPLFQQMYDTGEEAVLQNASATGGIRGGNTQASLADFGADTLNQALLAQLAQLGQTANIGMGATGSVAQFGENNAANVGNLYGNMGQVRAGGLLTRGGINSQMWNNAGSFLDEIGQAAASAGSGGTASIFKKMF